MSRRFLVISSYQFFFFRSDIFAYKDQMRRQNAEYKMNTIGLLAKLYQTQQELDRVGSLCDFFRGWICLKVQNLKSLQFYNFNI